MFSITAELTGALDVMFPSGHFRASMTKLPLLASEVAMEVEPSRLFSNGFGKHTPQSRHQRVGGFFN